MTIFNDYVYSKRLSARTSLSILPFFIASVLEANSDRAE